MPFCKQEVFEMNWENDNKAKAAKMME